MIDHLRRRLPARIQELLSVATARRLVGRTPAPVAERIETGARSLRYRQRDRRRQAAGHDGRYFDDIVAAAIEAGR